MCFPAFGDTKPDDITDGNKLVLSWLMPLDEKGNVTKSVVARSRPGRLPILFSPSFCCACTAAAACFTSDEVESDLWSIISDILRFFRIGFLTKEFDLDILRLWGPVWTGCKFAVPVWSGPYSHVTSQSLSLLRVNIVQCGGYHACTNQLSVSGDTVLSLFLDFIHVLHDAFSNLAAFA